MKNIACLMPLLLFPLLFTQCNEDDPEPIVGRLLVCFDTYVQGL